MQYRNLGRTGIKVSSLCLGTGEYGNQVSEKEAGRIMSSAMAAGVNFFDTADAYAEGRSEEIIGRALKGKRHSIILATKVGRIIEPGTRDFNLSRRYIMRAVDASLKRLQTDYIDVYYVHSPDPNTPIQETLRALDDLVHQGKVLYIGCDDFRAWQLCKALWVSDRENLTRFDCIELPYNLITRDIETELLPLCASEGVGVCVFNPLAGGLLTGKHDPDKPPKEGTRFSLKHVGQMYRDRYWSPNNFEAVVCLKSIADKYGHNLTQLALAWINQNEKITAAVCGASSAEQIEENIAAIETILPQDEIAACDSVWEHIRPKRFWDGR
jgi:aryl-alcohol dehydrogenase-like predicted oxidoreductase